MNENSMDNLGQVSPEEAMRQLVDLRLQVGSTRFRGLASQMGMPGDLLDFVEQTATQVESTGAGAPAKAAASSGLSGLVDASGRPLASANGASGLIDASGRPIGGGFTDASGRPIGGGLIDAGDEEVEEDDDEAITLSEEESQRLFQELVGVRMIVGQDNFTALAEDMGMPPEASSMVETAASQIEDEIASRYEDQDEAMTVRLVNARMMMGQERFAELAAQVGMPEQVVDDVEHIAGELESGNIPADEDEDEDEDLNA